MNDDKSERIRESSSNEFKSLTKNSIYSLFISYGNLILTVIYSILIARMISKDLWGYLLVALSYISIVAIISTFFPPALIISLNYYIPKYRTLEKKKKLKFFIKSSIFLRVLFLIPIYFASLFFFYFFESFYVINLGNYTHLLFILSPIIISSSMSGLLYSIYQGFFMFKKILGLSILSHLINIGVLICCFLFLKTINIELIALINLSSNLIPFLINCFIFLRLYTKIQTSKEGKNPSLKEQLKKTIKYGLPLSIGIILSELWIQMKIQIISFFEQPSMITGFEIARYYAEVPIHASSSLASPLITSLSSLYTKKEISKVSFFYGNTYKYSLFLLLSITGMLFFLVDFFLFTFYGESYLIFSLLIKIMLICNVFRSLGSLFSSLIISIEKQNFAPIFVIIYLSILLPFFSIGLIFFDIIGAIIGLCISHSIILCIQLIFSFKICKIRMDYFKIFLEYCAFFLALSIASIFSSFKLSELNIIILRELNPYIFQYVEYLAFISFLILFVFFNIIFRIFGYQDIEYLNAIFNENKKWHPLNFLKKIYKKK